MKHWRCSHMSTGGVEVLYTTEQVQTRIDWICKTIGDGICINVNVCASVHACVRICLQFMHVFSIVIGKKKHNFKHL